MHHKQFIILLLLSLLFSTILAGSEIPEKEVFKSIKNGETVVLEQFLDSGADIDANYGREEITLLNLAVKSGNADAVTLLLERNADPDKPSSDKTPLINAVQKNELFILHKLISGHANLNATVKKNNTALIYATKIGRFEAVKILIEHGADAEWKNSNGLTALDFANMGNYLLIAEYLVKIIEMRHYYDGLPNYGDGPHVEWVNDSMVNMFYMIYDTSVNYPVKTEAFFKISSDTTNLVGFAGDSLTYTIVRNLADEEVNYQNVSKILAIGDIHGHYHALVQYLLNNGVIDANLNWIWGDGHVVMLGDVFDRGNEVTESLWFIYNLDLKARKFGGRVHMLLGNHEVMVMLNDTRYLNRKYELFSNYFLRDYADFYGVDAVLGNWLRTRNTIIKINDCIFSHAGISPAVLDKKLSLEEINSTLRTFLSAPPDTPNENAQITDLIVNSKGPLWYRGYVLDGMGSDKITQKQVNSILDFYNAEKMIIAHTEVKKMQAMFDGKVIVIDVPIRTETTIPEALLIKDGYYFRLTTKQEAIPCLFEIVEKE